MTNYNDFDDLLGLNSPGFLINHEYPDFKKEPFNFIFSILFNCLIISIFFIIGLITIIICIAWILATLGLL
jgi:uncharacterized membrane protein SpoIIM required for sporulation